MAKFKKNLGTLARALCLFYLTTITSALASKNDHLDAILSNTEDNEQKDRMIVHMRINDGPFMIMVMASIGFVGLIVYFTYKTATMADGNKYSRL